MPVAREISVLSQKYIAWNVYFIDPLVNRFDFSLHAKKKKKDLGHNWYHIWIIQPLFWKSKKWPVGWFIPKNAWQLFVICFKIIVCLQWSVVSASEIVLLFTICNDLFSFAGLLLQFTTQIVLSWSFVPTKSKHEKIWSCSRNKERYRNRSFIISDQTLERIESNRDPRPSVDLLTCLRMFCASSQETILRDVLSWRNSLNGLKHIRFHFCLRR